MATSGSKASPATGPVVEIVLPLDKRKLEE
jgi:hypothetical protein